MCNEAFFELKKRLLSTPILSLPHFNRGFMVDTAASGEGLGAVLSQVVDGHECVVSYASRVLSRSERKYCATHREMLALVWAVHIFRLYLYGKRFTLRMDHSCLKWLHNFKEPEGQVARWLETWAEFDYEVVHRPGKQHHNADASSRKMCKQCGTQVGGDEITLEGQLNAIEVSATQTVLPNEGTTNSDSDIN